MLAEALNRASGNLVYLHGFSLESILGALSDLTDEQMVQSVVYGIDLLIQMHNGAIDDVRRDGSKSFEDEAIRSALLLPEERYAGTA